MPAVMEGGADPGDSELRTEIQEAGENTGASHYGRFSISTCSPSTLPERPISDNHFLHTTNYPSEYMPMS